VASVAVGVATLGWALTRTPAGPANAGAASVLGERILVADFGESAGDTTLGAVVAQALRMGLARSRQLRVTGSVTVSNALRRMRRAPDAPLAPALAREVAMREGIKAVLQGEVQRTGGRYLITAALEDAATGDRIEGWRVTAHDSTQIPAAVDRLIDEIRASVGISMAAIAASEPPQRHTTASLTALRKQWEGLQAYFRGDYVRAIRLPRGGDGARP
jgi:TolB-like protein